MEHGNNSHSPTKCAIFFECATRKNLDEIQETTHRKTCVEVNIAVMKHGTFRLKLINFTVLFSAVQTMA